MIKLSLQVWIEMLNQQVPLVPRGTVESFLARALWGPKRRVERSPCIAR